MGLAHILVFAALSGFSFGFAYMIGDGTTGGGMGFVILDLFSEYLDSSTQVLIIIISSVLTLFFVYKLGIFFRQVYEHRLEGIATSLFGFFGSLVVIFSPQENSNVFVLGIGLWLVGAIIVIFYSNKYPIRKDS